MMKESGEFPLSHFFTELAGSDELRRHLDEWLEPNEIEPGLAGLAGGNPSDDVWDAVREIIHDHAVDVDGFATGMEGYEFNVNVNQFGPLYWISAIEFDNDEYFDSKEAAMAFAKDAFSSFIEAYEESHSED